jgi:hypothetical protein
VLTLITTPVVYVLLDKLRRRKRKPRPRAAPPLVAGRRA